MNDFVLFITTAFALIFVIEGLLYALFPDLVRRLMALAVMLPAARLRLLGAVMACTGLCLVWMLYMLVQV